MRSLAHLFASPIALRPQGRVVPASHNSYDTPVNLVNQNKLTGPASKMPRKEGRGVSQVPVVLTVAGSDSGGGAGIQADLKTLSALGVFGTTAITALTAQNSRGLFGIHKVPARFLNEQLQAVLTDFPVAVIKTGMLPDVEVHTLAITYSIYYI